MADPNDNDSPLAQSYMDAIKGFEGYTPKAAWDVNNWRNGYGTNALHRNEVIDRDEASRRLNRELGAASNLVDTNFPDLPMGVRAALTSLTFNAGPGWMSHGLGNAVAKGDFDTARTLMSAYNRSGGQVLPGLTDRRAAEARWFGDGGALPSAPSSTPLHPAAAAFNRPSAGDHPYTAGPAGSSAPSAPQAGDWLKRLFGLGQQQQASGQSLGVAAGMPDMTPAGSASPAAPQVGQGGAGGAGGGNNLAQIQQIMGILNKQRNAFPFPDFKLDPVQTGPMHPLPLRMAQLNQALPQNLPFAGNSGTGGAF